MRKRSNNRGFTLLELIISLAISGLILVILGSSMMLSWRAEEKASERQELSERIRIITQRISWMLRGAYPFQKATPEGRMLYFEGKPDSLGLVTTSVIKDQDLINSPGLKWVKLYLDGNKLMVQEKLFFLKDIFDEEGGRVYTMADDIEEISFEYFDRDNPDGEEDWTDTWDPKEKDYLPAIIKVSIKMKFKERVIELPPLMVKIEATRGVI
ncbi:MAG: prepilin-type N-terminal cleavage/methylation domain-containing protein [Nitrospirae bacterium]|nr:prepilin-type N-terminal cleavage/methylation domain-containing protein [Nitrospirota bacterium]